MLALVMEQEEKTVTRFFKIAFPEVTLTKSALFFRGCVVMGWTVLGSTISSLGLQWVMTGHFAFDEFFRSFVSNLLHALFSYFWPSPIQRGGRVIQEAAVEEKTTTTVTKEEQP